MGLKIHSVEISSFFYYSDFMWNQFGGFLKCNICHFNTFRGSGLWFSMNFCIFCRLKFTKLTQFLAPKMTKMVFFELLHSPKLISCKIWVKRKMLKFIKSTKFRAPKTVKTTFLAGLDPSKLISSKIWVIKKSWHFHTVQSMFSFYLQDAKQESPVEA